MAKVLLFWGWDADEKARFLRRGFVPGEREKQLPRIHF